MSSEPRTILVTGGTGLVGNAMRALTVERGDRFVFWGSSDCNLTDASETSRAISKLRPNAIINLASLSGGVGLSRRHPATVLRVNLLINMNLLEATRQAGVVKLVLSLSSGMYGPDAPLPLRESDLHHGVPDDSNYAYAFAKRMIDPMIRAYREEHGLCVVGLSPNGIIGEHDHFHDSESTMTAALIRRFHAAMGTDDELVVWGDGSPLRELSDARDIARDFLWALDCYEDAEILNIGTTELISVREVAELVVDELGVDRSRLKFDTNKPVGIHKRPTDNRRFLALSNARYTPVRSVLRRVVRWYSEQVSADDSRIRLGSKLRVNQQTGAAA